MIPSMEAVLLEPGLDVHAVLLEPLVRLSRWATRRKRGADNTQLRGAAWGLLSAFDELLALPVSTLTLRVNHYDESEEPGEGLEGREQLDRLDALLESVRNVRSYALGTASETLLRALQAREPSLAPVFEERRGAAAERLLDWERWLVSLGAGTEEDADLGQSLVPVAPEDLSPRTQSIPFDL